MAGEEEKVDKMTDAKMPRKPLGNVISAVLKKCSITVAYDGGWHFRNCSKPVVATIGGEHYCKIHHPDAVKAREEKSRQQFERTTRIYTQTVMKQFCRKAKEDAFSEALKIIEDEIADVRSKSAFPNIALEVIALEKIKRAIQCLRGEIKE